MSPTTGAASSRAGVDALRVLMMTTSVDTVLFSPRTVLGRCRWDERGFREVDRVPVPYSDSPPHTRFGVPAYQQR